MVLHFIELEGITSPDRAHKHMHDDTHWHPKLEWSTLAQQQHTRHNITVQEAKRHQLGSNDHEYSTKHRSLSTSLAI